MAAPEETQQEQTGPPASQLRGIAFMVSSGAIFAFTDALAKVLTGT